MPSSFDPRGLVFGLFSAPMLAPLLMFGVSWAAMLFAGGPLIHWLKSLKGTKWSPREDTPDTHAAKAGTPSMGGIGIIGVACATFIALISFVLLIASTMSTRFPTLGTSRAQTAFAILLLPIITLAHAALGFTDDWSKATGRGGLRARDKLIAQIGLALLFVGAVFVLTFTQTFSGVRFLLFQLQAVGNNDLLLLLLLGAMVFVLIAMCNAVNLTDGIDGLAAGLAIQCGLALWLASDYRAPAEGSYFSNLFWMALAGACLGFLKFNKYKARVFMGDTGSLALGAALGAAAILSSAVFLLPFIGFIFLVETASVTLQVLWFKWTKKKTGAGQRLFKRAPLHHHFELAGWSEWRVVGAFWLVNLFTTAIGLLLWTQNILPRWP